MDTFNDNDNYRRMNKYARTVILYTALGHHDHAKYIADSHLIPNMAMFNDTTFKDPIGPPMCSLWDIWYGLQNLREAPHDCDSPLYAAVRIWARDLIMEYDLCYDLETLEPCESAASTQV